MRNHLRWIIGLAIVLGTPVHGAQSSQPASDTFTWVGELVSLDAGAGKITVKSRVAYQEALSELKQFKAGETVWVVWSGPATTATRFDSSGGQRRTARSPTRW